MTSLKIFQGSTERDIFPLRLLQTADVINQSRSKPCLPWDPEAQSSSTATLQLLDVFLFLKPLGLLAGFCRAELLLVWEVSLLTHAFWESDAGWRIEH